MKPKSKEIIWNIVNSLLAGSLIFFGAMLGGNINIDVLFYAVTLSAIVAITKFKDYANKQTESTAVTVKAFNFI